MITGRSSARGKGTNMLQRHEVRLSINGMPQRHTYYAQHWEVAAKAAVYRKTKPHDTVEFLYVVTRSDDDDDQP
jgi:hypothetical protein